MRIEPRRINDITIINPRRVGAYSQFSLLDPMPPEGPIIIATVLKQMGYDVRVIDESITPLYPESVLWKAVAQADIVGVSAMTCTENRGYYILRQAKRLNPGCLCVAGGIGPSSDPEKALKRGADIVVVGEGEETIRELMSAYQDGGNYEDVKGVVWREEDQMCYSSPRPLIQDLDARVPFADWSLLINSEKAKLRTITLSRGCPFRCTFCSVTSFYGASYRHRSIGNAVAYLEHAFEGHRPLLWTRKRTVFLGDDNIAAIPKWSTQYFREIARLNLPRPSLAAQMRVQACRNEELMDLARQAGVDRILFGYEDISSAGLNSINKRQSPEDIVRSVEECRKRQIGIGGMFMVGLDSHTPSSGVEIADFALEHCIDVFILYIRCPLPNTEDTKELAEEGRLLNIPTDYRDAQFAVFKPRGMTAAELQQAHLAGIRHFYRPARAVQDWGRGEINKHHLLYRLAGNYYATKMAESARRFTEQYLSR